MLTIHIQLVMQLELRGALRPRPYTSTRRGIEAQE